MLRAEVIHVCSLISTASFSNSLAEKERGEGEETKRTFCSLTWRLPDTVVCLPRSRSWLGIRSTIRARVCGPHRRRRAAPVCRRAAQRWLAPIRVSPLDNWQSQIPGVPWGGCCVDRHGGSGHARRGCESLADRRRIEILLDPSWTIAMGFLSLQTPSELHAL